MLTTLSSHSDQFSHLLFVAIKDNVRKIFRLSIGPVLKRTFLVHRWNPLLWWNWKTIFCNCCKLTDAADIVLAHNCPSDQLIVSSPTAFSSSNLFIKESIVGEKYTLTQTQFSRCSIILSFTKFLIMYL